MLLVGFTSPLGGVAVELLLAIHPRIMTFGQKTKTPYGSDDVIFSTSLPPCGLVLKVINPFCALSSMDAHNITVHGLLDCGAGGNVGTVVLHSVLLSLVW